MCDRIDAGFFCAVSSITGRNSSTRRYLKRTPEFFRCLGAAKKSGYSRPLNSRKRMVAVFVLLQSIILLAMGMAAFVNKLHPGIFIGLVILFCSFGALANPAYGSLLSDLVPENKRGDYFGWRNRNLGFVTIVVTLLAGFILNYIKIINAFYGFALIFIMAFFCRILSLSFINRIVEPTLDNGRENYFTIFDFLSRLRNNNFGRFVLFIAVMNFSVNLASPYFSVLMLKDLGFDYLLYTIVTVFATTAIFLTIRRWGRHADKVGNLKVIKLTAPLIGFIPLLWIINRNPIFLIFAQIFSGFCWAGFNLCSSNFIYDSVTAGKRTRCIAYFNLLNGLALCLGALLGGFLIKYLPLLFGYKILTLFFISSFLRISVGLLMPKILEEVRPTEKIHNHQLFSAWLA